VVSCIVFSTQFIEEPILSLFCILGNFYKNWL
jgi:hypothetical protein